MSRIKDYAPKTRVSDHVSNSSGKYYINLYFNDAEAFISWFTKRLVDNKVRLVLERKPIIDDVSSFDIYLDEQEVRTKQTR
jgi:hypothetical protein